MLKVKRTVYSPTDKSSKDIAKLQAEIKQSIQKLENDNKKKIKIINDTIFADKKKGYPILNKEKENFETRLKKIENYKNEQELIAYNKKAVKNFPQFDNRKRKYKSRFYVTSSSSSNEEEYRIPKKRRTKGRKLKHRVKKYYDDVDDAYYTENDDNDYEDYENSEENENDSETVKAKQKKKKKRKVLVNPLNCKFIL